MKPLESTRIVELAGVGPTPFCGMLLADLGADVIRIERPASAIPVAPQMGEGHAIFHRGKRSVLLDLKDESQRQALMDIVRSADGLIEGMRPGAAERLGFGPEACRAANPRLVYGRMTGWGQTGPLAQAAGHDLNYVSLSGASWYAGEPGAAPLPPSTLVGDVGGGAMYLALGMLAGLLRARSHGIGAVIDAAIVDGSANMMNLLLARGAAGHLRTERGTSLFDGPHWNAVYECQDGRWISVQALEPQFYGQLIEKLGLTGDPQFSQQYEPAHWAGLRARLRDLFLQRTSTHWCKLLEGTDVCFAPVLSPQEAAAHPHIASRGMYVEHGGVFQAAAAPRFMGEPAWRPPAIPRRGQHTEEVLAEVSSQSTAASGS